MMYRQLGTTVGPNLKKGYIEPCNKLSNSASGNVRHRRQVVSGTTYKQERKPNSDGKEAFRIP
ncbi:hypothetical protein AVEN_189793-1, partial [Araneus ventricosus]